MKIFLSGVEGALGSEFLRHLEEHQVRSPLEKELDLRDFRGVVGAISDFKPEVVCHLAAISDVDGCEKDKKLAYEVNVLGTYAVATGAARVGASTLYISTNYVFDGKRSEPYYEWDHPAPLGEYGRTKLLGEEIVRSLTSRYFIVRTSWLFGRGSKTFASRLLESTRRPEEVKVIADQFGSFTYTKDLADHLAHLVTSEYYGIYHLVNRGKASWLEFLQQAKQLMGFATNLVPVRVHDLKLPAARPMDAELGSRIYESVFGRTMRTWPEALSDFIAGLR